MNRNLWKKASVMALIVVLLLTNVTSFSMAQGTTDPAMQQDIKMELTAMKDLRQLIAMHTENIRLRIERVKRNIARLIEKPDLLSDDQINILKAQAESLVKANAEIKSGLDGIKNASEQVRAALESKKRRDVLRAYKNLILVQKQYLESLKSINEELLADMDTLLEIRSSQ